MADGISGISGVNLVSLLSAMDPSDMFGDSQTTRTPSANAAAIEQDVQLTLSAMAQLQSQKTAGSVAAELATVAGEPLAHLEQALSSYPQPLRSFAQSMRAADNAMNATQPQQARPHLLPAEAQDLPALRQEPRSGPFLVTPQSQQLQATTGINIKEVEQLSDALSRNVKFGVSDQQTPDEPHQLTRTITIGGVLIILLFLLIYLAR
jgi:hypothetical protein